MALRLAAVAALTLLIGWSMLIVALMAFEDALIFFPQRGGVGPSPGGEVWLKTTDGADVHGWYLTHPNATHTLLHLHGNAGNLESRRSIVGELRELGLNVLAIDYRGYGKSRGVPSEAGLYADANAAYAWLVDHTSAERVVVYGESLGGGPACELARSRRVGALILQSTFTSIADMGALRFPWLPVRLIARTRFDNLDKIAHIDAPKLFLHSRADEIIPFAMAERLYAAAQPPKQRLWLDRSGHNDLFIVDDDRALQAIAEFVTRLPR